MSDSFFVCLVQGDWYIVVHPAFFARVQCGADKYELSVTRDDFGGQGCTLATGACCLGDGQCVLTDEVDCELHLKGYYVGDDTVCQQVYCPPCPADSLYSQWPDVAERVKWVAGVSETIDNEAYLRVENFSTQGQVCALRWWGFDLRREPLAWVECDEPDPTFEVRFWAHDPTGNRPQWQIGPTQTVTATVVKNVLRIGDRALHGYFATLEPCVTFQGPGWVSIAGRGDPACSFLWFSSAEQGRGRAWFMADGAGEPDDFDLSLCLTGVAQQFRKGDLNCDGAINNFDIDPFVLALSDPAAYARQYWTCDRILADLNGDGVVDNFDIDPFVACLTNPQNCP